MSTPIDINIDSEPIIPLWINSIDTVFNTFISDFLTNLSNVSERINLQMGTFTSFNSKTSFSLNSSTSVASFYLTETINELLIICPENFMCYGALFLPNDTTPWSITQRPELNVQYYKNDKTFDVMKFQVRRLDSNNITLDDLNELRVYIK